MTQTNKLKPAILSLSLVTVMAGAAVSPALGGISSFYNTVDPLYIKMILTVPGLFIIITNLMFSKLTTNLTTKKIAITGLLLYLIGGCGAGFANSIWILLLFRAVLGVGVGLLMPLSTGLISYFFDKNEQSKLMGYSAAMNNLGGIIAMSLSGYLSTLNWRYSFSVYLLGLVSMVLVMTTLPDSKLKGRNTHFSKKQFLDGAFYFMAMLLTMTILYVLSTNFAMILTVEKTIPSTLIGAMMALQTLSSFFIGMNYGKIEKLLGLKIKYYAPLSLLVGYTILTLQQSVLLIATALFLIGIGVGLIVPFLNSNLLKITPKEDGTSIMALMGAFIYGGQFISPIITQYAGVLVGSTLTRFPYYFAIVLSVVLLAFLHCLKTEASEPKPLLQI